MTATLAETGAYAPWSVADSIPPLCRACECGQSLANQRLWWADGSVERAECPTCGRPQIQARLVPTLSHADFRRIAESEELQARERLMIERNPWYWVVNYLITEDPRAAAQGRAVYQRLTAFEYARSLVYLLWRFPRLAFPKSRQMTVTWIVGAWCLGECQFLSARLNMIQSKKAFDAVAVLRRIGRAYHRQQDAAPWLGGPLAVGGESYGLAEGHLRWENDSQLLALPEGAHHVQSHSPARLVLDEIQLQDEAEDAYGQALPTEAALVLVGSAEPSWFWARLLADQLGD